MHQEGCVMLGQFFRSVGFWTLDWLKGSPVRKRYNYLHNLAKNGQMNDGALTEILTHAKQTVPFYRDIPEIDINAFPVVCKEDYKKAFAQFRSSAYLDDRTLRKVFTSGSTGTPFMAYQDKEKLYWHRAGLISINDGIGWKLGARFMFMRVWGSGHDEGRLSQMMSNVVPVDVMDFDDAKKEAIRQRLLADKQLVYILGYATALESLSEYLIRCGEEPEKLGLKMVIADSENLSEDAKQTIEKAFGCPVLNRYGNNENGIIGLAEGGRSYFSINYPEYYVEVLNIDDDNPAPVGSVGRIVITDLYNKAFPFIRYDTGDLGFAQKLSGRQCIELKELTGRVSAALRDTNGNLLSETAAVAFLKLFLGIGRFQVAQTGEKTYELRIEQCSEEQDSRLIEKAKTVFGQDAEVQVCHVEKIPQGKNGKYKVTSYEVS